MRRLSPGEGARGRRAVDGPRRTLYSDLSLLLVRNVLAVACVRMTMGLSTWMLNWSQMRTSSAFVCSTTVSLWFIIL